MTDVPEGGRVEASEDAIRQRPGRESARRRPSFWARGASHRLIEGIRPVHLRRSTAVGTDPGSQAITSPAPRWRVPEWNATANAARWRALKAGLKLMGSKRKDEHKVDQVKSAELLAELAAGAPAALILASMFQRDDHGHKRIPVLLEQLKLNVTDSKRSDQKSSSDRHLTFRIELEYGSGLTRMKWMVHRSLRDFTNLHLRYKLQTRGEKHKHLHPRDEPLRARIPRFPRTAFPYLRGVRGLGSDDEDDGDDGPDDETASDGAGTARETRLKRKKKRPGPHPLHRPAVPTRSESVDFETELQAAGSAIGTVPGVRRETYPERQRKKLEQYLQQLIRHLIFRADSTRLCKFLELSSLGIRLAAEGGYHGKEGFLVIQSAKGLDFRRAWQPSMFAKRHAPKWFLVRHSYVVCVDSPEEMNIYDVFLVDSNISIKCKRSRLRDNKNAKEIAKTAKQSATRAQHHAFQISNSERKLKLLAKNERQMYQFEDSIKFMVKETIWSQPHRFDSFAPVRTGVSAQWLVDGRDYMWNVSRAINMARDVVYIHDWWLSPELYMRRPAAISRKWRLDRLLQRKATEGVKVFVIVYRNINSAVPIDSTYTKFSLLDLHPNIFVQRSPNQFRQNTFFWAHHEKLCIVDHTVVFVGGIDLCFGRWDTPQHSVSDDKRTGFEQSELPKDADHCQLWPGKDYSNPRVQDFYALDRPYEEMYDRTQVPRMPWHDISMQIVGQPARDLTRHFVQRWNYILRQRRPTRPTPFLLPPPDFHPAELEALGLHGTCEVQILRSACSWSIGTPDKTEHSIMNAYVKMIEHSEHFIYIENQFFISSCEVEGTKIENRIGDALVERAARAYRNGEDWRAIMVIPLMPGFQNTVDSQDGTSVRLIMQCQYRSICRGESSIFGRLRAQSVEPEDYIQFYSLRSWGKIESSKMLVTEQLYIHAKCMIVDDRIAIIGSANINERSLLGTRDSECAAVVRDTDMLESSMNGKPYLVGRFPHTLRMRLMREHLGIDVDEVMDEEREGEPPWGVEKDEDGDDARGTGHREGAIKDDLTFAGPGDVQQEEVIARSENMFSFNHDVDWEQANNPNLKTEKKVTEDKRVTGNVEHRKDVEGKGPDHMLDEPDQLVDRGRDSAVVAGDREVLILDIDPEGRGTLTHPRPGVSDDGGDAPAGERGENVAGDGVPRLAKSSVPNEADASPPSPAVASPAAEKMDDEGTTATATATATQDSTRPTSDIVSSLVKDMIRPAVDKNCMRDPLTDTFFHDIWHAVAENNTKLFRHVFRCMPDNEVKSWKEYKEFAAYAERWAQAQGGVKSESRMQQEALGRSGPPGIGTASEKLPAVPSVGEVLSSAEKKIEQVLFHKNAGAGGGGASATASAKAEPARALGNIADWADEADRVHTERKVAAEQAEYGEKEVTTGAGPGDDAPAAAIDEKASLRFATPAAADARSTATPTDDGKTEKARGVGSSPRTSPTPVGQAPTTAADGVGKPTASSSRRRRRGTLRSSRRDFLASDDLMDKADAEELLAMVQGALVLWPYDWLEREEQGGNWLYSIDQLAPLEI
ncbi:MAG: Phospholipase D1 [Phylliscum demangeonii]|nr:MAG: Phospholipase D1 [Phylliscum demangeonii]